LVLLSAAFHGKLASHGKLGGLPVLSHTTTVGKLVTVLQLPKVAKLPTVAKPLSLVSSPYLAKLPFVGKLPSSATLPSSDSFHVAFLTKSPVAVKANMLFMRLSQKVTCCSEGKHAIPGKFVLSGNSVGPGTLAFWQSHQFQVKSPFLATSSLSHKVTCCSEGKHAFHAPFSQSHLLQ
jgi:hypothetical protein